MRCSSAVATAGAVRRPSTSGATDRVNVRARGVGPKTERVVTDADIDWANVIVVMEREHRNRLIARFPDLAHKHIHVLDIPDDYQVKDPELVELLQERAGDVLDGIALDRVGVE